MPRQCNACKHPRSGDIAKAIAEGGSNSVLATRFEITESSLQRHRVNCLRAPRKARESRRDDASTKAGTSVRFENGRCHECGTLIEDAAPQALIKRAERLLWLAETIAAQAQKDDDARLALQAVDRARGSLEQLLKVHGLLQPDGATTVVISAEELTLRNALSIVVNAIPGERRQADAMELFRAFLAGEDYELPVTIDAEVLSLPNEEADSRNGAPKCEILSVKSLEN